jgi:hypothetical protein
MSQLVEPPMPPMAQKLLNPVPLTKLVHPWRQFMLHEQQQLQFDVPAAHRVYTVPSVNPFTDLVNDLTP